MIKKDGWVLETLIYTGGEATHTQNGTWLAIRNELSNTGYVLRISGLGVVTYENTDKHLGVGVNKYGSIRPMKGNADGKFSGKKLLMSELNLFGCQFQLFMIDLGSLVLMQDDLFVLALDESGLWRYTNYYGYCACDNQGRIRVLRTGFNAAY